MTALRVAGVSRGRPSPLSRRRRILGWVLAAGGVPLLTLALIQVRDGLELATVLVLFMALAVTTAAVGGRRPALLAAAVGFVAANWYFTPPYHRWAVAEAEHVLALAVFLGVAGLVSHFVDAAAHRHLDAARARAEARRAEQLAAANELRSAILQAVSHDLRTPLASIKASVSSLVQPDVNWSADETREFLSTIAEETDRLTALVTNLLDMSRVQAGAVQPALEAVGLEEVVPAAVASLGPRGAVVDVDLDETLPAVRADAALLERALANVIENAVRFTPPGRRVRVEAGAGSDRLELRVVDRGRGIPRPERERVFQPFQRLGDRRAGGGVGLGLAVTRGFVNAMGGTIEIEDTPGGGATVVVTLPVAR